MAMPLGTLTYTVAGTAFLLLSLLLLKGWRGRVQGILLVGATLATSAWAYTVAVFSPQPGEHAAAAGLLELVRTVLWFAFLVVLLGYTRSGARWLRHAMPGVIACCIVLAVGALAAGGGATPILAQGGIAARLVLAVIGVALAEQLFRNVPSEQRWAIKFLCLGLGAAFACEFYMYAEAMLLGAPDPAAWAARGAVYAFAVPLLAVSAARNPGWSVDLAVSRRIVFHSTAVLGAAAYLVVMSGAGYYVRYFGGSWGAMLQIACFFVALLLLLLVLFSGTLRARLKVFLSKNFFSYRYDYRDEWLRFTRTLSEGQPGVQLRERTIKAIAGLVDSMGGALWMATPEGVYEPVAQWNLPRMAHTERGDGQLARFLRDRHWVVDIRHCAAHPDAYGGLAIPEWLGAMPNAWLVVPLTLHEELMGFVVLARSRGKLALNWEVSDILKTAAMQAASYLAQCEAARALLVARQFESFNRMSAFIVHDLKNLVAQLSLMLANADRHRHKPEFQDDMLATVGNSVEKMRRLLLQLRGESAVDLPTAVPLRDLLRRVIADKAAARPQQRLELTGPPASVMAHPARLQRVIGHIVQNAIEATPAAGTVQVRLSRRAGTAVVEVADTGCGMSEQFMRERLFIPFESTKTSGMGIGTYEAREYVQGLGGRIEVESREGRGTVFRIVLPERISTPATAGGELLEVQT